MICKKCKSVVSEETSFCPKCGHLLVEDDKVQNEIVSEPRQELEEISVLEDQAIETEKIENAIDTTYEEVHEDKIEVKDISPKEKNKSKDPTKIILTIFIIIVFLLVSFLVWTYISMTLTNTSSATSQVHVNKYIVSVPKSWVYEVNEDILYLEYNRNWKIKTAVLSKNINNIIKEKDNISSKITSAGVYVNDVEEKNINNKKTLIFKCTSNGKEYYIVYMGLNNSNSIVNDIVYTSKYDALQFTQVLETLATFTNNSNYLALSTTNNFNAIDSKTLTEEKTDGLN